MSQPMTYRILWTWDSWLCDPFDADSYVSEYKQLIDFMAEWGYNGLVIWGFIDDRHGGEDSAKRIASYGADKGIRIMPGVGAGGYGGFVMTPGHPYNLRTFVEKHPHLAAVLRHNPQETTSERLCLYQEESLDWLREGAAWLAQNFEIGGVNIETNEMGCIDVCPRTEAATKNEPNRLKYAASFTDLSIAVPIICEEVRRHRPTHGLHTLPTNPLGGTGKRTRGFSRGFQQMLLPSGMWNWTSTSRRCHHP